MAKKFVRGITDVKTINNQDFDTNNVNDLLSDGQYNYIHRKKGEKEEYHNLTDNIKTISSDNTDLLAVTNNNKTTNTATLHPKHDAQKEQVLESTRDTITINHGANGTDEKTTVDTNPKKVLEHENLISNSQYVTIEHEQDSITSEIKTDKLVSKLNELNNKIPTSVGVRNLLEKTNQGKMHWEWSISDGATTVEDFDVDGVKAVKLTRTSSGSVSWSYIQYKALPKNLIEPNTQYTLSFDVKPNQNATFTATLQRGDGTAPLTNSVTMKQALANQWTKVSCVLTSKETLPDESGQVVQLQGMARNNGDWMIIKNIKLEKGFISSDWSPAPEDTQEQINSLNSSLAQKQNTIQPNASIGVSGNTLRQLYTLNQTYSHTNGVLKTHVKSVSSNTSVTTPEEEFNFILKINQGSQDATFTLNEYDKNNFGKIITAYGVDSSVRINGCLFTLSDATLTVTTDMNTGSNYVITFSDII